MCVFYLLSRLWYGLFGCSTHPPTHPHSRRHICLELGMLPTRRTQTPLLEVVCLIPNRYNAPILYFLQTKTKTSLFSLSHWSFVLSFSLVLCSLFLIGPLYALFVCLFVCLFVFLVFWFLVFWFLVSQWSFHVLLLIGSFYSCLSRWGGSQKRGIDKTHSEHHGTLSFVFVFCGLCLSYLVQMSCPVLPS